MKNKAYPLYEISPIRDLRELLLQKKQKKPNQTAFIIPEGNGRITEKTYGDFYREVTALGTWEYQQGLRDLHIGIIGENSYCQTAHCGRHEPHFDFGASVSPIVQSGRQPHTITSATARCRSLV